MGNHLKAPNQKNGRRDGTQAFMFQVRTGSRLGGKPGPVHDIPRDNDNIAIFINMAPFTGL